MHIYWICVLLMVSYSKGTLHPVSPCPSVFSYEGTESEHDRWFGTVLLSTDESLVGVRLDIKLDRPTQILVSWLGEVTTEDNERFTILSLSQKLHPGPALSSRFMVKFNSTQGSPQVRTIRLNGRQICPPDPNFPTDNQNNYQSNFMKKQDATERSTRRPDPDFEDNHQAPTTESTRRTTNRCSSEEHDCNPPKRENNNFYQENIVTQSTTKRYYDNDEDYPSRPNNQNHNNNNKNHNEKEGRNNNNEQLSTTKRYNNNEDDRLISNNHNEQKTTYKFNYKNENEGSNNNDKFSTTEQYNNIGDDRPGSYNYNQQKTTRKPGYKNENEGSNTNERFSTTKRYNNVEDDRLESNNYNQFKTTHKPNVTNNRQSTPKSSPGNKGSTTTLHNNNNQPLKSKLDLGSQELHLSTNYQVNNAQSNSYPGTTTKYKNDNSTMKETNSNNGKTTRLTGMDSSTSKNHNSQSDDLETAMTSMKCGSVEVPPAPLITNGQNTARGQWPWHIALYKIEGINLSYSCGGSLISSTAVITAAHCVTTEPRGRPVDADTLVVYLGKYHLYQFSDDGGVQNKQVRDVHVYPQYNNTNFHDDIAVLTLTSPVEYTTYVRPVCLWDRDDTDLNAVEGKEGTVVGWGYDENDQVTEELKMAHMPVVSQQTCIWSFPQFFSQFTSNKTFCAGFRKGTSVCNGDSGGGMVFSKESLWYLRGLVSITVARDGRKICDTNHYVVFTDAAKYLDWIRQYIT